MALTRTLCTGYLPRASCPFRHPTTAYETSGDAEAYGIGALLDTYTVVASIVFLSEILDILARMNVSMQRKLVDLSRLPAS